MVKTLSVSPRQSSPKSRALRESGYSLGHLAILRSFGDWMDASCTRLIAPNQSDQSSEHLAQRVEAFFFNYPFDES